MRVDVMQHYGFTQPLSHAGYSETSHHRQLMTDIKSAILRPLDCPVRRDRQWEDGHPATPATAAPGRKPRSRGQVTGGRQASDHPGYPHHRALL